MQNYSLLRDVGPRRPAGDAQARLRRDRRGMADGRRVHRQLRQPERHPLRARHPDVRDVHAQHDGPRRGAARPPPDPPAGDRRSSRTPPASAGWSSRSPSAASPSARTASWSRSTRPRTRRCPMPSSSSTSTGSATSWRARPDPRTRPRAARRPDRGDRDAPAAGWLPEPPMGRPGIDRRRRRHRRVPAARLRGELRLPGDKSISHRALILAALAAGSEPDRRRRRRRRRPLDRRDHGRASARPSSACADEDGRTSPTASSSPGADGLTQPERDPGLRQLRDEPAADRRDARRPADDRHPRRRCVIAPPSGRSYHRTTAPMGAALHARDDDSLPPLTVVGRTPLRAVDYTTPVPSAQVKSAILLAGLRAEGRTTVREPVATRDHTERMLRARGVPVDREARPGRRRGVDGTKEGWRCRRSTSASRATCRRPPSGWSPGRSIPMPS